VTSIGDRAACLLLWRSLLSLVEARGAVAQTRGGGALLEVAAEGRDHERTEDEVGATEHGKREPEEEKELEDKVKWEPVDNVNEALGHSEECEHNPVGQPLSIIISVMGEEGGHGVVARDDESSDIGKKLATEVEDNEEEVQGTSANHGIGFGDTGLLLDIVDGRVLGQLGIEHAQVVLGLFAGGRHVG
jgi:hypothetical protein